MGDKLWSYFRHSRTKLRESDFCPLNEWMRSCLHLERTKCIQVTGRDLKPQYRCLLTSSNSGKRDRRCINQLGRWKCHRWPWWAASKVSRLLWHSVLSVHQHERAFPYLNARKHSESVLAWGNLILENSSSGKADFGLPSCLTVRLAVSSQRCRAHGISFELRYA